ncbi:MAG: hypothetical protein J3Q66DRAFT_367493 [Benniella sp.]|nr:MAG: hypothetical protein J3Q66DRAFT_367493 [Benniella sp.]
MSASSMSPSSTLSQASPSSMATASNDVLRTLSMSSANGHGSSSGTTAATSVSSSSTLMAATHTSTLIHHNSGSIPTGVSNVKLKRVLEHNQRLKEQLDMGRISVSEASQSTRDSFLPNLWGSAPADPFSKQNSACCIIS